MKTLLMPMLAVVALAAFACQPPPGEPSPVEPPREGGEPEGLLTTDRGTYSPGDTATLRLRNVLGHEIGYNLCFSSLERLADGAWRDSEVQDDRVCTAELRLLPPGEIATFDGAAIPSGLPAGEYRFRTRVEDMSGGSDMQARSNPFSVR
jgi:hypothetical protein